MGYKMAAPMRVIAGAINRLDSTMWTSKITILPHFRRKSKWDSLMHGMTAGPKLHRRALCSVTTKERIFIDTHSTVKALEKSGFSLEEAEGLSAVLLNMMQKSAELNEKELVTKEKQEVMIQQIMSNIASVKKDMVILEKSEFSALRSQNEKLKIEVQQLKQHLKDEIQKQANTVKLDINLERSRAIGVAQEQEKKLEKITQVTMTEIAKMMAKLEATKTDLIKYFAGTVLGCLTMGMGAYRIMLM